jgi:hypothetical protein
LLIVALRPAVFDEHVTAFDIAGFAEAQAEGGNVMRIFPGRRAIEKPDHRHCRLLRACGERPCGNRAALPRADHRLLAAEGPIIADHFLIMRARMASSGSSPVAAAPSFPRRRAGRAWSPFRSSVLSFCKSEQFCTDAIDG